MSVYLSDLGASVLSPHMGRTLWTTAVQDPQTVGVNLWVAVGNLADALRGDRTNSDGAQLSALRPQSDTRCDLQRWPNSTFSTVVTTTTDDLSLLRTIESLRSATERRCA